MTLASDKPSTQRASRGLRGRYRAVVLTLDIPVDVADADSHCGFGGRLIRQIPVNVVAILLTVNRESLAVHVTDTSFLFSCASYARRGARSFYFAPMSATYEVAVGSSPPPQPPSRCDTSGVDLDLRLSQWN